MTRYFSWDAAARKRARDDGCPECGADLVSDKDDPQTLLCAGGTCDGEVDLDALADELEAAAGIGASERAADERNQAALDGG